MTSTHAGHGIEGVTHDGTPFSAPLISQIDGNLWIGGVAEYVYLPEQFRFVVNLHGIEHWACAAGRDVVWLKCELADTYDPLNVELLEALAAWVNFARSQAPVLVHCRQGLNRSALVAALALVRSGMTAAFAISLLRARHAPEVLNNTYFEEWLRARR